MIMIRKTAQPDMFAVGIGCWNYCIQREQESNRERERALVWGVSNC